MQSRQILLIAGIAIVAFAAAFGIAGAAGGGDEPKAASAGVEPAKVIEVGDANVSAGVNGGGLPALQLPKKKPKPDESSSSTSTSTSTTTTTTAPTTTTTTTAPTTTTTAPTTTAPTTTAPTTTSPPPSNNSGGPVSLGGGED